MKSNQNNVFSGDAAIRNLLDPDQNPPIPLVELPESLNPFKKEGVRIYAKLMYLLPLLHIKSLTALGMLLEAEERGDLKGVHTLVENSSGNTVAALAILAKYFGINHVKAIVPSDIAEGKFNMNRLFGSDQDLSHGGGIEKARELGQQPGFCNLGQYENESNPNAHERWTGPQIWSQTEEKLTLFCSGLGTTGTILGASRYFRKQAPNQVKTLGVACAEDQAIPGVRSLKRLEEVEFNWRSEIDGYIEVRARESFKKSLELIRAGLMAGPSSGFALVGLLEFLSQNRSELDLFRNKDGEVVAVFICPDNPLPYSDKYFTHLNPADFGL